MSNTAAAGPIRRTCPWCQKHNPGNWRCRWCRQPITTAKGGVVSKRLACQ